MVNLQTSSQVCVRVNFDSPGMIAASDAARLSPRGWHCADTAQQSLRGGIVEHPGSSILERGWVRLEEVLETVCFHFQGNSFSEVSTNVLSTPGISLWGSRSSFPR